MWAAITLAIPAVTAYAPSDYTVPALYNLMLLAPWPFFLPILALRLSNLLERSGAAASRPGQRRLFGLFYLHKGLAAAIVAVALLFLPQAPALCGLVFVWVWASCQLSNQAFTNHFLRPVGERVSVSA